MYVNSKREEENEAENNVMVTKKKHKDDEQRIYGKVHSHLATQDKARIKKCSRW